MNKKNLLFDILLLTIFAAVALSDPIGWCEKKATQNTCNNCTKEEDCGGITGNTTLCSTKKDPKCVKGSGFCAKSSPQNSCGPCEAELECGGTFSPLLCWATKDPQCNQPVVTGWCSKASSQRTKASSSVERPTAQATTSNVDHKLRRPRRSA